MRRLWALAIRLLLVLTAAVLLFDAVIVGVVYWEYGLIFLAGMVWELRASAGNPPARTARHGWRM